VHTHTLSSVHLPAHKAAQPNTNISAPFFHCTHTNAHGLYSSPSLSLALSPTHAHTPAITVEALSEMGHLLFVVVFRLFYVFFS